MLRVVAIALALTCSVDRVLFAHEPSQTPIRDAVARVRITAPTVADGRVVGWIERVDEKTLTLAREGEPWLTIDRGKISRVERPNGKRSRAGRIVLGSVIGMVAGYGMSRVMYDACGTGSFLCELDNLEHRTYGVLVGGSAGALIGLAAPTQRWKTVPLSTVDKPAQE